MEGGIGGDCEWAQILIWGDEIILRLDCSDDQH